jgi:hypothetical protein
MPRHARTLRHVLLTVSLTHRSCIGTTPSSVISGVLLLLYHVFPYCIEPMHDALPSAASGVERTVWVIQCYASSSACCAEYTVYCTSGVWLRCQSLLPFCFATCGLFFASVIGGRSRFDMVLGVAPSSPSTAWGTGP